MKRLIFATMIVMASSGAAFAQTGMPKAPGAGQQQPDASTTRTIPEAPIGHRQPRRSDFPPESDLDKTNSAQDKKLDRSIRGICKGC